MNLAALAFFRPTTILLAAGVVLGVGLAGASPARAQGAPSPASPAKTIEALPVATYVARQDAVPVRAEPGFVYREISRLAAGGKVEVDGRQGQWLRVRGGGWVFEEHVRTEAEEAAAPAASTRLVVAREGARVRASASTDAAVVATLKVDAVIDAVGQENGWWQLASGGFISASVVRPAEVTPLSVAAATASRPDRPLPWVVSTETANVRAGRGSESAVVRRLVRGDIVTVTSVVDGWAQVEGGWIRQDLLQPPSPPRAPVGGSAGTGGNGSTRRAARWSLMDLNGTVIEVYEIADTDLVAAIRMEMRDTRVLESDWVLLGITVGVPADATQVFTYSPDGNAVHVKDVHGQVYGNVYAKGPLDRLPSTVRGALEGRAIRPGQRFDGVLLFRPTLKVRDIAEVTFDLDGRSHRLLADR